MSRRSRVISGAKAGFALGSVALRDGGYGMEPRTHRMPFRAVVHFAWSHPISGSSVCDYSGQQSRGSWSLVQRIRLTPSFDLPLGQSSRTRLRGLRLWLPNSRAETPLCLAIALHALTYMLKGHLEQQAVIRIGLVTLSGNANLSNQMIRFLTFDDPTYQTQWLLFGLTFA
ncbi:hypothetical protein VNO77_27732 [Canavalia gladiata]|uniref:Uncharacterized protein n=1 Tax=Canavalia gladiata TaxID=3824 RepID=A0AAN9KWC2_CANGL